MPFPAVPPKAGEDDVAGLAEDCLAKLPEGATHVLLQGEFTLAFALVRALQRRGLVCLAATTAREVDDLDQGRRVSRFGFVRFREYPS